MIPAKLKSKFGKPKADTGTGSTRFKSKPGDPLTEYSFKAEHGGVRELPDTPSNRSTFGFINPNKTSREGLQILSKGLRSDSPQPQEKTSAEYHQTKARYDSTRPGSSYTDFGFDKAILGHHGDGCSGYWNREGHKHSRAENMAWCRDPANYWGPEHEEESNKSGGSAPRYIVPSKELGSHRDWWNFQPK